MSLLVAVFCCAAVESALTFVVEFRGTLLVQKSHRYSIVPLP